MRGGENRYVKKKTFRLPSSISRRMPSNNDGSSDGKDHTRKRSRRKRANTLESAENRRRNSWAKHLGRLRNAHKNRTLIDLYYIIKQRLYWALLGFTLSFLAGWLGAQYAGILVIANPWLFWLPSVIILLPLWAFLGLIAYVEINERRQRKKQEEDSVYEPIQKSCADAAADFIAH